MRYLYRAKRTDNGEWVEGFLANGKWYFSGKEICAILPLDLCFFPHCEISEWIEIDPSTICQCTGLKDKNGKLIWENDIVNVSTNKGNTLCEVRYAGIVAHFQLWQFKTIPKTSTVLNLGNYEEEDIGNRFDNPELLEK